MHQVTNISYGEGSVNIVLDSSSQMEVTAPEFRFGDYSSVVTSCFTQKELERISEGENALLTFYFVVSDEVDDEQLLAQYSEAIEKNEEQIGRLTEGIYLDVKASKTISDDKENSLVTLSSAVDVQMDIPLYLIGEGRSYFFLSSNMGNCELIEDVSPDADVLTISTDIMCPGVVLYQDIGESLVERDDKVFSIKTTHLAIIGIAALVILWAVLDRLHKNSK